MLIKRSYTAAVTDANGRNSRIVGGEAEVLSNAPDRAVKNVARHNLEVRGMYPTEIDVAPKGRP